MAYHDREVRGGGGFGSVLLFVSGVVCGLLVAAKPGKETREDIVDWWNRTREKREALLNKGKEALSRRKEPMASEGGKEPFYESGKYT